jgi:AcrR family transcriptional regulator
MNMQETQGRTQPERTAAMRARLIEATLATLLDTGYSGTTLVGIAKAAGVTRGALNHHFESKDDLVVAAVSSLLTNTSSEIRGYAKSVQDGTLSLPGFLDRLWELFSGPFFMVTLEHLTASRHNPLLKTRLVLLTRDFHRALDETWSSFFTTKELQHPGLETVLNATLCLLRGMGVQTVLRDDPAYYKRLLAFWKDVLITHTGITHKAKERQR